MAEVEATLTALPCPFCGNEPTVLHGYTMIIVRCSDRDCPVSGATFLIGQWNARAVNSLDANKKKIATLQDALKGALADHSCDWNGCWCADARAALEEK